MLQCLTVFLLLITSLKSVASIVLVACCKKRRRQKATSSHSNPLYACGETVTTSHENHAYEGSDHKQVNQSYDHEYVNPNKIVPTEWSKSQSDLYDDIGNKDLMEGFSDDPIYDCLELPQKGKHTFSFDNQSSRTSSDT